MSFTLIKQFADKIFSVKPNGKHKVLTVLGLKINLKYNKKRNGIVVIGENNLTNINKECKITGKINGNNNKINIGEVFDKNRGANFHINIYGNNNTVNIESVNYCNNLHIDIGNYTGVDNVTINIGKNFTCVDTLILAYMHGVPVTIGNDCLFSRGINIRTGELPHIIYDNTTKQSIDCSSGVKIGNKVWLGENCFVLKHSTIADNSIVGSAAVVTKKFEETNVVIAGNPAKICKQNVNWALSEETRYSEN